MKTTDLLEKWKISKLINYLNDGKFVKLPHQRPLTLKKNSQKRFIDSTLNNRLLQNFILADLNSSYECSEKSEDKKFFNGYLKKGFEYSIEDCQHRMSSLQLITDDDFINEYEGKKDEFYNSEVPVLVIKNRNRDELISDFGEVNSGKTVTNDNLMWGVDNLFNSFIKERFINNEKLLRLYKFKNKSESVERKLYSNVLKIIKVCAFYEGLVSSPTTNAPAMMSFIKDDMTIKQFNNIVKLFDLWYDMVKDNNTKDTFTTQSNLFFIIHALNSRNIIITTDYVDELLLSLSNTRPLAETRYGNLLSIIDEK